MSAKAKVPAPVSVTPVVEAPFISSDAKVAAREKLDRCIKDDTKTVKGRFRCFETPNSSTRIQIKKYKEVPMFDKTMTDGEVYEVPLYVARHLNGTDITATAIDGKVNSCSYPVHGYHWAPGQEAPKSAGDGVSGNVVPLLGVSKRVRRYGFESLEFQV